jgi:dopamine D1-like receptor
MELFSLTSNTTITDIQWQAYPVGFFLLLLCLLTILGNILIIYVVIRESTLHTPTYYYIASLAFADLFVGLIAMPFAFIFEMTDDEYWLFPRHLRFLCDFWHSMDIFASTASIFGLSAIGLDRYMAITKPIEYPNLFISKRWYYMLSLIWICSAVISFPAVVHFGTEQVTSRT